MLRRYKMALEEQPTAGFLANPALVYAAIGLVGLGNIFVVTSTLRLGITGTFLGMSHS